MRRSPHAASASGGSGRDCAGTDARFREGTTQSHHALRAPGTPGPVTAGRGGSAYSAFLVGREPRAVVRRDSTRGRSRGWSHMSCVLVALRDAIRRRGIRVEGGLRAPKDEAVRRRGVLGLLDVFGNAGFGTGFTDEFASVAAYERVDRDVLRRRPPLAPPAARIVRAGDGHGRPRDRGGRRDGGRAAARAPALHRRRRPAGRRDRAGGRHLRGPGAPRAHRARGSEHRPVRRLPPRCGPAAGPRAVGRRAPFPSGRGPDKHRGLPRSITRETTVGPCSRSGAFHLPLPLSSARVCATSA